MESMFENGVRKAVAGTTTLGDGNRVAKTVGGVTTQFLVDDRNLTGYAQVVAEIVGGNLAHSGTGATQAVTGAFEGVLQ